MRESIQGINLLRHLADQGLRIFSIKDAKEAALFIKMRASYVPEALTRLYQQGWINRIKRGVYAMSAFGHPPHDFAIAMALVTPCAISHWTAMHYHHITEQTPRTIFATTPLGSSIPRVKKHIFQFVRTKKENYFGTVTVWIDSMKVQVTDLERTLLDGLIFPQYCGGFSEVLTGFQTAEKRIRIKLILEYAMKLGVAPAKRLGFILESLGVNEKHLQGLLELPSKTYFKLNPQGPARGKYNTKWKIRINA